MRHLSSKSFLFIAWAAVISPSSYVVYAQTSPSQSETTLAEAPSQTKETVRYNSDFFAHKNPKTAFDMVNLLPGFTFSAGDTSVRGYAAAEGNVLIDGERVSDKQFTLDSVLQHIPADQVESIEVIQSGRPGLEMLGQTTVANVIRRKSAGNSTVVSLSDGFFLDGRNTPLSTIEVTRRSSSGKTFTGAVSASQYVELAEGNGPQVRRDMNGNVLDRVSVASTAGGLTAYSYGVFSTPAWKGQLSINASVARTDYVYRETDSTTFQQAKSAFPIPTSSSLKEHLGGPLGGQLLSEFGAHFNRSFGERWTSESVALVDLTRQTYSSTLKSPGVDEQFNNQERLGEALMRTNLRYSAATNLSAEFSAEAAYNWLNTSSLFSYNAAPITLPNAQAQVSEIRGQALGHLTWSILKSIELDLGMQVEDSTIASHADAPQSKKLTYLKPRIALTFKPDQAQNLRLRVEREVGQLDFNDFIASSSLDTGSIRTRNTNIVPQQDWAFEAAYERHFWSEGDLVLTYRHLIIADAIDRVPVYSASHPASAFDAPGNIGTGSENTVGTSLTVPLDHLYIKHGLLKLAGTRLWSSVTDPTTGAMRPITDLKPFEYSIAFRHDLPQLLANWGFTLLTPCSTVSTTKGCSKSEYRFNEIDAFRAAPTLNAFVEQQIWKGTTLRLEADNVFEQRYQRVVNIYDGPRGTFPLAYADKRNLTSTASFVLSLRKVF